MLLFTEQQGPSLPRNLKHSGSLAASHHGLHDCLSRAAHGWISPWLKLLRPMESMEHGP